MAVKALLKLDHFSGPFSFDMFFETLVKDIAPVTETAASDNTVEEDGSEGVESMFQFPEALQFLPLFNHTRKALGDLCYKANERLNKQCKEVVMYEKEHKQRFDEVKFTTEAPYGQLPCCIGIGELHKWRNHGWYCVQKTTELDIENGVPTLFLCQEAQEFGDLSFRKLGNIDHHDRFQCSTELQDGVEELTGSFNRLDSRVVTVGQTAAKIGDHLESSDSQKNIAIEAIDLVRHMMYFNECTGYVGEEPSLFCDDDRVAEATTVVQKLRAIAEDDVGSGAMGAPQAKATAGNANGHLEVAARKLQSYCNDLENCLLGQFDAASQKGDLWTMGDRAKILTQFNKGSSMMQRYVASRPMFMDVEVMNKDVQTVLGPEQGHILNVADVLNGLTFVYKEIAESVQAEAQIVSAVFPSPAAVMSILVQRVMEQRVNLLIEKILSKPPLSNPPPMEEGGLQYYVRILEGSYAKTIELTNEFQTSGCGDLNVEAFAESLFKSYREDYAEFELTSLSQLYAAKIMELKSAPSVTPRKTSLLHSFTATPQQQQRKNSAMHSYAPISVAVVEEIVGWNEEAVARCKLLTLEDQNAGILATNVKAIFTCLLDQVSQYVTEGLERAIEALKEAAALLERFGYSTTNNRKVAQAMATSAEAASSAGESSFRAFMAAIKSATTNMAMLQLFFTRSVSRVLLAQEGAHAACCDAIASAMAVAEKAASTGLRGSLDALLAEVERLLVAEQKVTDYKQLDESISPELTTACSRVVAFLTRMIDVANGALDGLNKEAFMTQLGNGLYNLLIQHWKRFTFDPSGGLRLKRDVSEYADCMRSFVTSIIDEKFALLGTMVNVFIVAPESLPTLVDGTLRDVRDEVLRLIELREDYKKAKVAKIVNNGED